MRAAIGSGEVDALLTGFVQKAPRSQIVAAMPYMAEAYNDRVMMRKNNDNAFHEAFARSIKASQVNRIEFLAESSKASFEYESTVTTQRTHYQYRSFFLYSPYIETKMELFNLLNKIMESMGKSFLDYFLAFDSHVQTHIIKQMKLDQGLYEQFGSWLAQILDSKNSDEDKFRNCLGCLERCNDEGIAFWEILQSDAMKPHIEQFQNVYKKSWTSNGYLLEGSFVYWVMLRIFPDQWQTILCDFVKDLLKNEDSDVVCRTLHALSKGLHKAGIGNDAVKALLASPEIDLGLRKHLDDFLVSGHFFENFPYVIFTQIYHSWKSRLASEVLKRLQNNSTNDLESSLYLDFFDELKRIYRELDKIGLLNEFYKELWGDCHSDLRPQIEEILTKYNEEKKKNK